MPANASESSSSRLPFWSKFGRNAQPANVKFVPYDPSAEKKPNRISRLVRRRKAASSQGDGEAFQLDEASDRRKQVYQAQKRHRNRKADYILALEGEIARLQHLDARVNNERNALEHQNKAMRRLLASRSVDHQLESLDLNPSIPHSHDLGWFGATVQVRFDADVDHDRTFLDPPYLTSQDMIWQTDEMSGKVKDKRPPTGATAGLGDSMAAMDFILALEWPCQSHTQHKHNTADASVPDIPSEADLSGHTLTATAAVHNRSLPAPELGLGDASNSALRQNNPDPSSADTWQLSHAEIDKLVALSEQLGLDEDYITPAQAYAAVRRNVPNDNFLRPILGALKKPLGSLVQCHGFGACMDAVMFWQELGAAVEAIKVPNQDLVLE